jgi:hypothetical protein
MSTWHGDPQTASLGQSVNVVDAELAPLNCVHAACRAGVSRRNERKSRRDDGQFEGRYERCLPEPMCRSN